MDLLGRRVLVQAMGDDGAFKIYRRVSSPYEINFLRKSH